jgi:hypothetical protein
MNIYSNSFDIRRCAGHSSPTIDVPSEGVNELRGRSSKGLRRETLHVFSVALLLFRMISAGPQQSSPTSHPSPPTSTSHVGAPLAARQPSPPAALTFELGLQFRVCHEAYDRDYLRSSNFNFRPAETSTASVYLLILTEIL